MRNESDVKRRVSAIFKKYGVWYTSINQAGYNKPGVPDYLACVKGRMFGVEAKFGKNKTTPMQDRQLLEIRQAGGATFVVNEKNLDVFESELWTLLQ
jgi:hypothetical protein